MTQMAILQEIDKCMRCNGCVTACKREWNMKLPTDIAQVTPQKMVVNPRQRLAIKSQKRPDMGPFIRFTCWHCPDPPCAKACPFKAIKKQATGAVAVDNALCNPTACYSGVGPRPCEIGCQRGGYPRIGVAYKSGPYSGSVLRMNKCTLCWGRAGSDAQVGADALQTTATAAEIAAVPEKAHMPACVSSCPAKAMKWDTRDNILAYLNANYRYGPDGVSQGYQGNGSLFWASKKYRFAGPKADPYIEDHLAPTASGLLSSPLAKAAIVPTILVTGLMALSARRAANEELAKEGEVA